MSSKVNVAYHSSSSDDEDESDDVASDTDAGSENSSSDGEQAVPQSAPDKVPGTEALVDVMSKILGKQMPKTGSVILSKADTDKMIQQKRRKARREKIEHGEKVADDSDSDSDVDWQKSLEQKKKKLVWENMGRVKPSVLDRERGRGLQRIATRGVVQLFNAVKKQQKIIDDKKQEVGPSVRKQEKVMQTMTKGKFLDVLKGTATNNVTIEPVAKKIKKESEPHIKKEKIDPSWSILRDDFMMGAKMKDWDMASDDDEGVKQEMSDNSDLDT